jgi:hypothetical protein
MHEPITVTWGGLVAAVTAVWHAASIVCFCKAAAAHQQGVGLLLLSAEVRNLDKRCTNTICC